METVPDTQSDVLVFNIGEAKTNLSRLLTLMENGEKVAIARDGTPIAMLSPIAPRQREFGFMPDLGVPDAAFFDPLPEQELAIWEGGA